MKKLILLFTVHVLLIGAVAQEHNDPAIHFYGQVMTDAGYNFNQIHPAFYDVMRPTQLPSYKNEYGTDGNMFFGVPTGYQSPWNDRGLRQTRGSTATVSNWKMWRLNSPSPTSLPSFA
jgi:hypothetical protein